MAKQTKYKIQDLINASGQWINRQPGREAPFYGEQQTRGQYGTGFLGLFDESLRNPELDPAYKLYLNEGLSALRGQQSLSGSPSSGRSQIGQARYAQGMAAQQLSDWEKMKLAAANFQGVMPQTQMPNFLNSGANAFNAKANLMQAQAAQAAAAGGGGSSGGFSSGLGSGAGMLGGQMMNMFGGSGSSGGSWSGATTGGGFDAWDMGGFGMGGG